MERIKFISIVAILSIALSSGIAMAGKDALLEIPDVSRDKVICFALYTVHNNIMKMTAQLYPLKEGEDRSVRLQLVNNGKWVDIAKAPVIERGWTAHFRVEGWDSTKDIEYRLAHGEKAYYTGLIRKDPVDKETIVIAAFTGNSVYPGHGGDIPKADIVENLKKIKPDLLFFSGDQVYDHTHHYTYWLKFGRDFGEVIRNTPTITIPDDHDVGQANLWGAGGKKSNTKAGHDGGYFMPVEYVKEVERAQTSHLPDPFDPTPIEQGIGVYYTTLNIGRISFAIVEDRKFKSGPQGLVPQIGPRPDHIRDANYDPKTVDVPGAVLLGERQLKFLREWGGDWQGVDMKAVLSQTIFCGGAHIHGKVGGRLHADMDSNGWPQSGRNKALAEIRRCFAVHIAGDQHLATIFHHGIDDWEDACYSFCVPSIANFYLRWWDPLEAGQNRQAGMPEYSGRHLDGFGNKVTCWAAANPSTEPNGDKLTTRAAGFGVVKFNKKTRQITFECRPRNIDVTAPGARQYPGWPKTIGQIDNYGRKAEAYLPTLEFKDMTNPVVQVIDESSGEIVYTLRINGTTFEPKVFGKGTYTIKVGKDKFEREMKAVKTLAPGDSKTIHIKLN
ncbi:MAG: metallophosphoesterase family protein [Planctomycetota bacterium]|jgi:hypothetical protein